MKGIILAGGTGSHLFPLTTAINKHLLPIYNKPMIYYPLSTLMLAGIKDILIVCNPDCVSRFECLLGDGSQFGIALRFIVQPQPNGIADALRLVSNFIKDDASVMILGDNVFWGRELVDRLHEAICNTADGYATVFGYYVSNAQKYGIMELDLNGSIVSVEEKPLFPKSNYCITGLYFFPSGVSRRAAMVVPSLRGELEITDVNDSYLRDGLLKGVILSKDFLWFDAGDVDSLLEASLQIRNLEIKTGELVSSPDEIAFRQGWIDVATLHKTAIKHKNTLYGQRLYRIVVEHVGNEAPST